jgi:hypothetical protein
VQKSKDIIGNRPVIIVNYGKARQCMSAGKSNITDFPKSISFT